jgi:uncharacterized protein (DUF924 family)
MASSADYKDILQFWFSEGVVKLWFNSTPEFDHELREKYETVYRDALTGKYDSWMQAATGCLALIILFDQIPLNIYRGQKQSFATEARAREVASHAILQSFDQQLNDAQKAFMYMPFMHSESLEDQKRAVELFENANLKNNLRFAHHHRSIIERFGRFPHRNRILGRESTEAELEYLQSKEAFLG